jgi:hypothetical protein
MQTLSALCVSLACAAGCVSATFHSKTGQSYASLTSRAVAVADAGEARQVERIGTVIGTISTDGTVDKRTADLADKAAEVAANNGGTHVILSQEGTIDYTTYTPEHTTERCRDYDDGYKCRVSYHPASEDTTSRPTADFIVVRVPPERWAELPDTLRPGAR